MDVTLLHFICEKGDFTVARYGVRGAIFQSLPTLSYCMDQS